MAVDNGGSVFHNYAGVLLWLSPTLLERYQRETGKNAKTPGSWTV